jgi:hypothetical protein
MKKIFLLANIFTLFFLSSCSDNNRDEFLTNSNSDVTLDKLLREPNLGVISYMNRTSVIVDPNKTFRFRDEKLDYELLFSNLVDIEIVESKSTNNEIKVINSNTGEFMIFKNIEDVDEKTKTFDLETSTGYFFESITLQTDLINQKCAWCPLIPIIVETIKEILDDSGSGGYDENCAAAIEACGDNGVSSIELIDGGWFSDSSCTVICK